jgi:hypothetical protein
VELLREGDVVVTAAGEPRPIRWIGHRRIDCRRHPKPHDVWPVRVHAGAFGDGLPRRELWLSPDHAVFVEGVLIPVRYLINGRTIVQQRIREVTYYHVELATHDVILAEGLPCESYLDTGNRSDFANGGAVKLHPTFARGTSAASGCAELVLEAVATTGPCACEVACCYPWLQLTPGTLRPPRSCICMSPLSPRSAIRSPALTRP